MEEITENGTGDNEGMEVAPMGGVMPEPVEYAPISVVPISPLLSGKLSETAIEFLKEAPAGRNDTLRLIGKKTVDALKQSAERRKQKDEAIREFQRALDMETPDRESPLGEDGANLRTPLTWKIFTALHAFYLEALTGIRPYIKTEPGWGGDLTIANKIEGFYDSVYDQQVRFPAKMDRAIYLALADGTSFLYPRWNKKVRVVHTTDIVNPKNAQMFGLELVGVDTYADKTRKYRTGSVFSGLKETVEINAPEIDVVSYFDFFMSPASSLTVEEATIAGRRQYVTIDWIRSNVRAGIFDSDAVKTMEESKSLRHITDMYKTNLLVGDPVAGAIELDDLSDDIMESNVVNVGSQRRVEIFDGIIKFDGDGDNLDEVWNIVVELSTGVVLRMVHYGGGSLPPFVPVSVFDRPGKFYGMSLCQILDNMQAESDMTANLILDAAMLANTIIVEEGEGVRSPLDTNDLAVGLNKFSTNSKAGEGFAVHNLAPNVQSNIFPARTTVEDMASDATAASETLIGRVSDRSGTTAFETNQAMVAGARRLKVGVDRIREAAWKAHTILHNLCVQSYALTGGGNPEYQIPYPSRVGSAQGSAKMTLEEFLQPVRFFVLGDGINTDKALQLQAAEKLYLMSERSPFITSSRERQYAVTAAFLSAYNQKDYLNFIGSPEDARKEDQEAEQKASDPLQSLPQFPENARPEFIAAQLVRAQPEAIQAYLQVLTSISEAINTGKNNEQVTQAKQDGAVKDAQFEAERAKYEREIASLKVQMEGQKLGHHIEKTKTELDRNAERITNDQKVQEAHQQAERAKVETKSVRASRSSKSS